MKRIYKLLIIPFIVVFFLHACTDGFESINTNPNRTDKAEPEYIFGLTPVATLRVFSSNNNWFYFGNYTNQMSVVGGSGPHFGKDGRSNGMWQDLYVQGLNPLYRIVNDYGDNPAYTNRVAIAKIWRCYILSQMVAMWGPIPYTDGCNEGPYMKYDDEATIYRGILAELKEAYTALNPTALTDKYPETAEPFLQSKIDRWSQFAHCIRLRVAFRISEVEESVAPGLAVEARRIVIEELENADKGLLISDNAGNFYMQFQSDLNNQNPFFKEIDNNPDRDRVDPGNYPVIHESLVMWMGPFTYSDPCLTVYMKKGDGKGGTRQNPSPDYFGRPYANGTPEGYQWPTGKTNPYDVAMKYLTYSQVGKEFAGQTAKFSFFTYPEIVGIKAEAKYKGIWDGPKSAEEYYYDLIDARCARFSITGANVDKYKNFPGIKWSTPSDTVTSKTVKGDAFRDFLGITNCYLGGPEDNYKRIVVQEWINFFYQGVDSWTLLRRTQVMPFKPHWNAELSTAYVSGTYAYVPNRLIYPDAERSRNAAETQNAIDKLLFNNTLKDPLDQVTFRLIFCKDYAGLQNVPMNGGIVSFPNTARNRLTN